MLSICTICHLFCIEILERNQSQFENSLRNIKEQFGTLNEKFTAEKLGSFSIQNHLKETDCHLRTGDSFRLRSVKFPDYEMGVTSVKLKDEFCYVGLRKVRSMFLGVFQCLFFFCYLAYIGLSSFIQLYLFLIQFLHIYSFIVMVG